MNLEKKLKKILKVFIKLVETSFYLPAGLILLMDTNTNMTKGC